MIKPPRFSGLNAASSPEGAPERKQNRPGKQAGRDSGRTDTEFKGEACRIWNR